MLSISVTAAEDVDNAFAVAFNACDLDALMALYEPNAIYVSRLGPVQGIAAIRESFQRIFTVKSKITMGDKICLARRNLALVQVNWELRTETEGQSSLTRGKSLEILRRQADGRWRYLIDHPNGAD